MLRDRDCCLDLETHRYYFNPDGQRIPMRVSVTGVTNWGKDPNRFKGFESSAHRGTHTHRAMECLAKGLPLPDPVSPEGIDCSDWFHQLQFGKISANGMTMEDFWSEAEVLACEFTMVSQKRSLGGQLDLLVKFRGSTLLVDLKTKSASHISSSKEDRAGYAAQAGGYLWLMDEGDGAKDERPPYVEKCRTLIVTPKKVDWLTAMDPTDCAMQWEEAWGAYSAASLVAF